MKNRRHTENPKKRKFKIIKKMETKLTCKKCGATYDLKNYIDFMQKKVFDKIEELKKELGGEE